MKIHRIRAVVMRHMFETWRNYDRITDILYWPVMDIIMWGFFTFYLTQGHNLRPSAISCLLGAIILWNMFRSFQRDMAVGFLAELWSRNLVNLFSTPLTITEYMTGLVLVNLAKVAVGMAFASCVAWGCYSCNVFPSFPALLPFMLSLMIFALSVGIMTTALIFRFSTKIQGVAWSFVGLLMPISCVFYPMSSLPTFLHPIAMVLPTTHVFEGMRQVMSGGGLSHVHLAWCLGLNLIYMLASLMFFRKVFESARTLGLLVRTE